MKSHSHVASAVVVRPLGLRITTLAAVFALFSAAVLAQDAVPPRRPSELLAQQGRIAVTNAGAYVAVGTFQIQVAVKLGSPTARLDDGTWLYDNFRVGDSNAHGTLVLRFEQGRVRELSLVTPAVAMAMLTPRAPETKTLVAQRQ